MAVSKNLTYLSGASSAIGTSSTKKKEEKTQKLAMPNALTNSVPSNNSSANTILKNMSVPKTYTTQTTPTTLNTPQVTYPSMLEQMRQDDVVGNNPSGLTYRDVDRIMNGASTPSASVISAPTNTSVSTPNLYQDINYKVAKSNLTPSEELLSLGKSNNNDSSVILSDLVPGSAEAAAAIDNASRNIYGTTDVLTPNVTLVNSAQPSAQPSEQSSVSDSYADVLDELANSVSNQAPKTKSAPTSGNANGSTGQPTTSGTQSGYAFTYNGETITPDNPDYERYLNEALEQLGAAYNTRQQALSDNYESALAQLKSVYDASASNINNNSNEALRQAYIDSMLGRRDLARRLSNSGVTGGAVESVLANMYNNYGNNRNAIENQRSNNLNSLASTYNSNVANLGQNYNENYADALADYQESTANVNKNFGKELAEMLQKTSSNAQAAYQAQLNAALESALNQSANTQAAYQAQLDSALESAANQMQNNTPQSASNPSSAMQNAAQSTQNVVQNAQSANELANVNGRTNVAGNVIRNTTGRGIAPANGTNINLDNSGRVRNVGGMTVEANVVDNLMNLNAVDDYNGLASYVDSLGISGEQAEQLLRALGIDTYRLSRLINL